MITHKELKKWDVAKLLITKMDYKLLLFYLPQYDIFVESISPIPVVYEKLPHGMGYHFQTGDQKQPHVVTVRTQNTDRVSDFIQDFPEFRAYRIFKHGMYYKDLSKKSVIGIVCEATKNMLHLFPGKTFRIESPSKGLRQIFYEKAVEINDEDKLGCLFDYDDYDYSLEIRPYKRFKNGEFYRWAIVTILYGRHLPNKWSVPGSPTGRIVRDTIRVLDKLDLDEEDEEKPRPVKDSSEFVPGGHYIQCNRCDWWYPEGHGCPDHNPWKKCQKKPLVVQYRDPNAGIETIKTREGTVNAFYGHDYIIMGIAGELYPISKEIFEKSYTIVEDA